MNTSITWALSPAKRLVLQISGMENGYGGQNCITPHTFNWGFRLILGRPVIICVRHTKTFPRIAKAVQ